MTAFTRKVLSTSALRSVLSASRVRVAVAVIGDFEPAAFSLGCAAVAEARLAVFPELAEMVSDSKIAGTPMLQSRRSPVYCRCGHVEREDESLRARGCRDFFSSFSASAAFGFRVRHHDA